MSDFSDWLEVFVHTRPSLDDLREADAEAARIRRARHKELEAGLRVMMRKSTANFRLIKSGVRHEFAKTSPIATIISMEKVIALMDDEVKSLSDEMRETIRLSDLGSGEAEPVVRYINVCTVDRGLVEDSAKERSTSYMNYCQLVISGVTFIHKTLIESCDRLCMVLLETAE